MSNLTATSGSQSIDSELLTIFCKVAETENFSRAAALLDLDQPVVTRKMKRLEEELGVALFLRSNRGCQLTHSGKVLASKASDILLQLSQLREEVASSDEDLAGSVSIGMTHSSGRLLATRVITTIAHNWPSLRVSITEDVSRVLCERLLRNEISLALLFDPPPEARFVTVPLLMERLYLIGAPDSALVKLDQVSIEDLVGAPLILPTRGLTVRTLLEEAFAELQHPLEPLYETNSISLLISFAAHGLGYTVLTFGTVAAEVAAGRLAARPINAAGMSIGLSLVTIREHHHLKTVRSISDLIQRETKRIVESGLWQGSPQVFHN